MSRVYFHAPSDAAAELLGSERARADAIIERMTSGIIAPRPASGAREALLGMIPPDHYLHQRTDPSQYAMWLQRFQTAWRGGLTLQWRGHDLDSWTFTLNTALQLGNDPVRFLARMHGQCEIHGWVDGPNRAWLAEVITDGVSSGIYRPDAGWQGVIALLRQRDSEPVVMSYSVCEPFPNSQEADWMPPWPDGVPRDWGALSDAEQESRSARAEAWYDLPPSEQWERGMRRLRTKPGSVELKPDNWKDMRFGHGLSNLDLIAPDRDARLERALSWACGGEG